MGFVIEFIVNETDILLIPLAYLDIINDDDVKQTLKYEKEVVINPKTSDIKNVKRVKR